MRSCVPNCGCWCEEEAWSVTKASSYTFNIHLLFLLLLRDCFVCSFSEHDECLSGLHNCDENALCFNMVGGHSCSCKPGYTGNGTVCKGRIKSPFPNAQMFLSSLCSRCNPKSLWLYGLRWKKLFLTQIKWVPPLVCSVVCNQWPYQEIDLTWAGESISLLKIYWKGNTADFLQ